MFKSAKRIFKQGSGKSLFHQGPVKDKIEKTETQTDPKLNREQLKRPLSLITPPEEKKNKKYQKGSSD
jgi:hypothetical protein